MGVRRSGPAQASSGKLRTAPRGTGRRVGLGLATAAGNAVARVVDCVRVRVRAAVQTEASGRRQIAAQTAHAVAAAAGTTAGSLAALADAALRKWSSRAGGVRVQAASAVAACPGTGAYGCACCRKSDVTRARSSPRLLPWSLVPSD